MQQTHKPHGLAKLRLEHPSARHSVYIRVCAVAFPRLLHHSSTDTRYSFDFVEALQLVMLLPVDCSARRIATAAVSVLMSAQQLLCFSIRI